MHGQSQCNTKQYVYTFFMVSIHWPQPTRLFSPSNADWAKTYTYAQSAYLNAGLSLYIYICLNTATHITNKAKEGRRAVGIGITTGPKHDGDSLLLHTERWFQTQPNPTQPTPPLQIQFDATLTSHDHFQQPRPAAVDRPRPEQALLHSISKQWKQTWPVKRASL